MFACSWGTLYAIALSILCSLPERKMKAGPMKKSWRYLPALPALMLSGCTVDLLQPAGPIAEMDSKVMILEFVIMLLIVIPTIIATLVLLGSIVLPINKQNTCQHGIIPRRLKSLYGVFQLLLFLFWVRSLGGVRMRMTNIAKKKRKGTLNIRTIMLFLSTLSGCLYINIKGLKPSTNWLSQPIRL